MNLKFTLKGNNRGISKIWVGFSVLRVKTDTTTKDFSVNNAKSANGRTEDNKPYDVKFEPV